MDPLDLNYHAAVPHPLITFTTFEGPASASVPPRLNAIYMPTQAHRPPPATDLTILCEHCDSIILLFTNEPAPWSHDLSVSVEVHCNLPTYLDLNRYLSHPTSKNPSAILAPDYDIPAKRTWALAHARSHGFTRIGLLDDDICLTDADLLRVRIALAHDADFLSFHVFDFPDVSTVDHIERLLTRQPSWVSLSGNCLFFNLSACRKFFPFLYNDDWFFILFHVEHARIWSLGSATQRPYAPWENITRIRFEQFGDMLIEAIEMQPVRGHYPLTITHSDCKIARLSHLDRLQRLYQAAPHGILRIRLADAIEVASAVSADDMYRFISCYTDSELSEIL